MNPRILFIISPQFNLYFHFNLFTLKYYFKSDTRQKQYGYTILCRTTKNLATLCRIVKHIVFYYYPSTSTSNSGLNSTARLSSYTIIFHIIIELLQQLYQFNIMIQVSKGYFAKAFVQFFKKSDIKTL